MYIIGTAGHVDHGKSALVKALTATDPDRLPEEKERSLTIELGFASYTNKQGFVIGVIDVPGHERFIRNMVSGVWSLDGSLLCVAADDGWMQQSRDHALVLKAMGARLPMGVITKSDLVSEERLSVVKKQVAKELRSIFGSEPIIHVISSKEGRGIEELKESIDSYLTKKKTTNFPPALALDRSFLIDGVGAVGTGSLRSMELKIGDEVTLLPSNLRARIRTLQSFGKNVERVKDGSRVAISLRGIEQAQLPKGAIITNDPTFYMCTQTVYVALQGTGFKRISQLEIAGFTWHDQAKVRIIGKLESDTLLASVTTNEIRPWYIGQKVVLIQSGASTIRASAQVITSSTLNKDQRTRLGALMNTNPRAIGELFTANRFLLWLNGYAQIKEATFTGSLLGESYQKVGSWYLRSSLFESYTKNLMARLAKDRSVALAVVMQESPFPASLTQAIVTSLVEKKQIVVKGTHLEPVRSEDPLSREEERLLQKITAAGLEGYPVKFLSREEKPVLGHLRQRGAILIVESTFIYSKETFDRIVSLILKDKEEGTFFSIAEAKEHLPLSRKYILPLLNKLEELGYVQRIGDERKVLKNA